MHPHKTLGASSPIKTSPFVVPSTTRKDVPTRNTPIGDNPQTVTSHFPKAGGTRTTEVTKVIFHLINNDCLTSISPPVRGRILSFRRDLLKEKCSNNMLNIITCGYVLPLIIKPKLDRLPLILSGYKAHQKNLAPASCIQSLLSKNTIVRVENTQSLGFYSPLFLVPKPHEKWRPVIDLSKLNTFLLVEKFKMETP